MLRRTTGIMGDIFRQADPVLLALCCAATGYGLLMITSATRFLDTYRHVILQGAAAVIGIALYFLASMVDVTELVKKWKWIFLFNIGFILLLKTPLGEEVNGNLAWLDIPLLPVNIQPAEFVKLTFIILLAYQLVWLQDNQDLKSTRSILMLGAHLAAVAGLYCVVSSDMGSTLVYAFAFAAMAFAAGTAIRWFVIALTGGGIAFYLLWELDKIPEYMKDRFRVVADHSYRPLNEGWHQTRSLLALGGGKVTGQGLFNGTQTQSEFSGSLPYRHTDFIFSVIGEELGMLGCLLALALLAAIVIRCLMTASLAKSRMEAYICVGMAATLIFQTVSNVGMCLFIMPVIGLTLPFFSYGGSSILTLFLAMGIVSGIRSRTLPEWLRKT